MEPAIAAQNAPAAHVSAERVYLNTYTKLVVALLNSGGSLHGTVVTDWVVPRMWPHLEPPFAFETINRYEREMYRTLRNVPIHVYGCSDLDILNVVMRFGFCYTTRVMLNTMHYFLVNEYVITENVTQHLQHEFVIRGVQSLRGADLTFDVNTLMYSTAGLTTTLGFNAHLINEALAKRCTLVVHDGIDDDHPATRAKLTEKIFDQLARGWTIRNVPVITLATEQGDEHDDVCPICHDEIGERYTVLGCACHYRFHLECVRRLVASELDMNSIFKCPCCRAMLRMPFGVE